MNDDFDVERALRAGLAANARHAPNGDALAERIIAAADQPRHAPDPGRPRRWRSWTLPLVAAGSVAAVVAAIVGAAQLHRTSAHPANTPTPDLTTPAAPTSAATSAANTSAPSATTTSTAPQGPSSGPVPVAFRVTDLTFVGASTGFALGTGQCFTDPANRCTALLRTNDAGKNWVSIPNPPANIGTPCTVAACVNRLRFADEQTGYAFGPTALFMTTDGGEHWTQQPGGATSLEVENGTVLRVPGDGTIQRSDVGTDAWRNVALPSGASAPAHLQRALHNAYVTGEVGGGANPTTNLYASPNDGTTWVDRANPCQRMSSAHQLDIADIAVGAEGSVTLLCADHRGGAGSIAPFLITSGDAGATFGPSAPTPEPQLAPGLVTIGAADSGTLLFAADALYRSTDHGTHWQRVATDATTGSLGGKGNFLGFETPKTGRWVSGDGSTVWTTTDAGATWSPHTFQ